MRAENFVFAPGAVEFVGAKGMATGSGAKATGGGSAAGAAAGSGPAGQAGAGGQAGTEGAAMKIVDGSGLVRLKGVDFSDGTIEFDILPEEKQFSSMYFRWQDSAESECFYFRTDRMGQPQAIQYTPIIGGINCWNLFDDYQTAAEWQPKMAIHTKLVVSGKRLRVYLNHGTTPALDVPRLEGNVTHGSICFEGKCTLSNLIVAPGRVDGLSPAEGPDAAVNDPHYIRHWQVTKPKPIPAGVDFSAALMPDSQQVWQPIDVERRGMVNLTRAFPPEKDFIRRIIFLRTTLHADQERTCHLQLGFMNEIWVWLNGQWLYLDKNLYGTPIAKQRGRISIDNGAVSVPLRQGDNELLVAIGGGFYGWGLMARIGELEGITMK